MSTRANANEPPSPQDRTRGLAENRKGSAITFLIAGGLICLAVSMICLDYRFGPAVLSELAQFVAP
jgi:hypothetical protein